MKFAKTLLLALLACTMLYGVSDAKRGRKLPEGAYIKSAKIHILSGDTSRYRDAIAMLDSLGMHYGPHAEALSLTASIYIDFLEKESDFSKKPEWVAKFRTIVDSLHWTCENEEIDKDYRKDCDEYVEKSDSTVVRYWRLFYNAGVGQLTKVNEFQEQLKTATDSFTISFATEGVDANLDSCVTNFNMAITLDSSDHRAFVAMGNAYQLREEYDKAVQWMEKGLAASEETNPNLINEIAYTYVQQNDYCKAASYFNELANLAPDDLGVRTNLAICLNNCQMYDSAKIVNMHIIEMDSTNVDAWSNVGRYFNQIAREANDSASYYREREMPEKVTYWQDERTRLFDSAKGYFAQVFEMAPDDEFVASEYGMISYVLNDYQAAAQAFQKLTEIAPQEYDYWVTLGDSYLQLQRFEDAANAYQAAVDLKAKEKEVLERLVDLYRELNMPEKRKKVEQMLAEL